MDMTWRFAEKHQLRALWFNNDCSATRVLTFGYDIDGAVDTPEEADATTTTRA